MKTVGELIYSISKTKNGFYVDVGAFDGITQDETIFLDRMGWDGICIEGHPEIYKKLKQNRKLTYQAFVGGISTNRKILLGNTVNNLGSSIIDNIPEDHQQVLSRSCSLVEMTTKHLEDILDELDAPKHITLLKSDTEGSCLEIVKSLSFTKYTFDFISLELGLSGGVLHSNFEDGAMFLQNKGYKLIQENLNQNDIFEYVG